jgi:hypothetical protein
MYIFFSVYLVGGESSNEGNVFAFNPANGIDGPVCDDSMTFENVNQNSFKIYPKFYV